MRWFMNCTIRTKLLMAFGVLGLLMAAVAATGYEGLRVTNTYLGAMHDEHLSVGLTIAETGSQLNAVRASLLGMMATPDREAQAALHAQIKAISATIDGSFRRLRDNGALPPATRERIGAVEQVWQAFRDTRDTKLIPAILEGRLDEARALATGIQAERFRTFSRGASDLVGEAQERARQFKAQGAERFQWSVKLFIGFAGLTVLASVGLGVGYARIIGRPLVESVAVLEAVAAGDLTRRLTVDTRDEVGRMTSALNEAMARMREALEEVRATAGQVATSSRELSAAVDPIASGAQEQASSLEETAASLEEIAGTVKQTADNAQQASQLAADSRDVADEGGRVVTSAVEAMTEITRASKQIVAIITAIDEIAFQTNLLALNAAVEAARAGDQGRGFAVVAAEVRNLAQRSAAAAREIKGLIQDSVAKVESGSVLVNRSGQALGGIVASALRVTHIVAEIATASQEQTTGIDQVNRAVTQMDQVTQANAAQTEELSSTAQSLAAQAEQLQALVARFKLDADAAGVAAGRAGAVRLPLLARRPAGSGRAAVPQVSPATVAGVATGRVFEEV